MVPVKSTFPKDRSGVCFVCSCVWYFSSLRTIPKVLRSVPGQTIPATKYSKFRSANSKLLPPGGEPLIYHGSIEGTMVTLHVRLTMQSQHKPIRNFVYTCSDKKEKSHEKRYNDISRLNFSVTACIWIQQHLSEFWKKPREKRIYVILCTGLGLNIHLATINTTF